MTGVDPSRRGEQDVLADLHPGLPKLGPTPLQAHALEARPCGAGKIEQPLNHRDFPPRTGGASWLRIQDRYRRMVSEAPER